MRGEEEGVRSGGEAGPFSGQAPETRRWHSRVLKFSLFAAGCAGLVAEFVLSTLASYLLGNSTVQWTLTISLMLFSMGLGSRLSRHLQGDLLDRFIGIELILSLLCASCALACYALAAFLPHQTDLLIYSFCLAIGLLIGLEIPLVTRINQAYESLRVNISSVMESDYYGALVGGVIFAFLAFPWLGLTYTPVALGGVNLLVALVLYGRFRPLLHHPRILGLGLALGGGLLLGLGLFAQPILLFGEQSRYR
ncbi:MAG: spermidine synthase, partial [Candidatus Tectomicrobia bacterium]|nr:spermidine synthase [Candidatus Tectomicrobia bacterium]